MKFPKSVHAEGWSHHFEGAPSAARTNNPAFNAKRGFKAGAKPVSLHTPLQGPESAVAGAASLRTAAPMASPGARMAPSRASSMAWVMGAGVGALLIGAAFVMARHPALTGPSAAMVVGQVAPSPEEVQLQAAPPSAGAALLPADAPAVASSVVPSVVSPVVPAALAEAPAPGLSPAGTGKPAPVGGAPVIRSLAPQPEASEPTPVLTPAASLALAASAAPVASAATAAAAATIPSAVPPALEPQPAPAVAAAVPDPADVSITLQVRQALAADATLAAVVIAVSTDHGVVKLEGQAPDAQARDRATVVAANTTGVKAVDNRLKLAAVVPVAVRENMPLGGAA